MTLRTTKDGGTPEAPGEDEIAPGASGVIALIRPHDHELMQQLPDAVAGDLETCATVEEFVEKCTDSRHAVAVLPIGVLPEGHRAILRGTPGSMSLRPSIVMYSPSGSASLWSGILDAGDLSIIVRPLPRSVSVRQSRVRPRNSKSAPEDSDASHIASAK